MNVLIACEFSGIVRDAFIARGHNAISCDLLSSEKPGPHFRGNVLNLIYEMQWDLIIAHPPCTYLSNAGARHLWKGGILNEERYQQGLKGKAFFMALLNADIPRIAVENPVPSRVYELPKCTQYIQPYQFGHKFTKRTGLWLNNLPPLEPTNIVSPEYNLCPSGTYSRLYSEKHKGLFTKDRAKNRSRTAQGIADAMAEQWG